MSIQTILGAGGIIGMETAKALTGYTSSIRLVSRNPKKVNDTDELIVADLTNQDEVMQAVEGSEVVYLTAGLPYSYKVWSSNWPVIMRNVIEACKKHKARLVFFDNVYLYDSLYMDNMTERTPLHPVSKKGQIREMIANMLMTEVERGSLTAVIARSADFYGPGIKQVSVLTETVFKRLAAGGTAFWPVSNRFLHSFTYTPDAGRALALLGNSPKAFNDVWHLPTAADPLTGKEWISEIAREMQVVPKSMTGSRFIFKAMGIFDPVMREMVEMLYQYERDYVFNSSKFEEYFNFRPTPYAKGIEEVVKQDYASIVGLVTVGT
ncbi:MAG: NAD-dependent epimerase/dehydratase family protein [Bacteroidales bacterium]|nr:NAD-dependent epimerase/dehydratase family protein [Bacteroidales bacterium]